MMEGMIVLNEYTQELTKTNPVYIAFMIVWLAAMIFYWILRDRYTGFALCMLVIQILCVVTVWLIPKQVVVDQRRVVEAYLDTRTTMARVEREYDIIEQRGKIYVLAEKETVDGK